MTISGCKEDGPRASREHVSKALERLVGQGSAHFSDPVCENVLDRAVELLSSDLGLGFSQFNELLLQLGYDRVCHEFFQYLLDGALEYQGECLKGIRALECGVERFRRTAMLQFGNVKFGFKQLSADADLLRLNIMTPIDPRKFEGRHKPALDIQKIPGEDTYFLGYLIKAKIDERLGADPNDALAKADEEKRKKVVTQGVYNHQVYLCFDHMDVYVATSMRESHEYALVSKWTDEIFACPEISDLKVRWFDPTQAYCVDRIDKGLAEALMLKRAFCTLYFAQESDTLGKDSELASTLAQGKPVIAYIPQGGEKYVDELCAVLRRVDLSTDMRELMLHQLRLFQSELAWQSKVVRQWLDDPTGSSTESEIRSKLIEVTEKQYDRRARLLRDQHPLGIQVHLQTGVANGVLVVRSLADCARIIRRVLLNELEFDIQEERIGSNTYIRLIETISGSVFRVMTGDAKLTNSFWNFYLN